MWGAYLRAPLKFMFALLVLSGVLGTIIAELTPQMTKPDGSQLALAGWLTNLETYLPVIVLIAVVIGLWAAAMVPRGGA